MRARAAGRPVSELLNQGDMFGGETSALAKRLILNDKGNLASRDQISARLQKYAGEAQKNLAGPGLFGDTVSPTQVLKTSLGESAAAPAQEAPMASAAMKPGPVANLDAAAAARLQAASAATKARVSTFDTGPVGDALRKGPNSTDYRAPDSSLPGKFFAPGPGGAERVEAFREAAGASGPPNMNPLHDAAAESLRNEAMKDGMIDPGKFAAWQKRYANALRELPPDLRARFASAASASDAVADATEARKGAIDGYQKSVAGKFLKLNDPADITKTISGIFGAKDAVRQMSMLARQVKDNPDAAEGLRKAVADVIMAKAKGATRKRDVRDRQPESVRLEEVPARQRGCNQSCGVLGSRVRLDAGRRPGLATRPTDARRRRGWRSSRTRPKTSSRALKLDIPRTRYPCSTSWRSGQWAVSKRTG